MPETSAFLNIFTKKEPALSYMKCVIFSFASFLIYGKILEITKKTAGSHTVPAVCSQVRFFLFLRSAKTTDDGRNRLNFQILLIGQGR